MTALAPNNSRSSQPKLSLWQTIARHPFTIAAVIYFIANGIRYMLIKDFSEWDDVFVLAATQFRRGADFYQLLPQGKNHLYSYPPLAALLVVPFSVLPRYVARFLWYLVTVASTILLWRWSWRLSGGGKIERPAGINRTEAIIAILGLLCTLRFVQETFDHQQTDLFIGAILIGGCLAWRDGFTWRAASCWGFAGAIKGPPMLFAAYLVFRGKFVQAGYMILLAIALNLLPDLFHRAPAGLWVIQWYREILASIAQIGQWHSDLINNQAIAGAARRYFATTLSLSTGKLLVIDRPAILIPASLLKILVYTIELAMLLISAWVMGRPFGMPAGLRAILAKHAPLLLGNGSPASAGSRAAIRSASGAASGGSPACVAPYASAPRNPTIDYELAPLECGIIIELMLLFSPMSSKPHFCVLALPAFCIARIAWLHRDRWLRRAIFTCIVLVVLLDRLVLAAVVRLLHIPTPAGDIPLWLGSVMFATIVLWLACLHAIRTHRLMQRPIIAG